MNSFFDDIPIQPFLSMDESMNEDQQNQSQNIDLIDGQVQQNSSRRPPKRRQSDTFSNNRNGHENQPENACKYYSIFKEKKFNKKQLRSCNVPKMIMRIFKANYKSFIPNQMEGSKKLAFLVKKITKKRKGNPNNQNINDIVSILKYKRSFDSDFQKLMAKVLQRKTLQEITLNNHIKQGHVSYMLYLKLYAIRCRNPNLCQRVQF